MINIEIIIKEMKKLLKKAYKKDEMPVAAIITYNNKIIAKTYNKRNKSHKTIDHAEIIAITKANKVLKDWRINKCSLYITIEPCEMCKTVIKESRIENVYYFLNRSEYKKQHDKTNFKLIKLSKENEKFVENYQNILKKFWENKR